MGRIKKEAGGRDYCWMVLTHFLINQTNCQTTQCRYKHKQTAVWATCSKLVDQGKLKSCVTMVTGFFFFFLQRVICDYAFKNMLKTRLQFKKKKCYALSVHATKKGGKKAPVHLVPVFSKRSWSSCSVHTIIRRRRTESNSSSVKAPHELLLPCITAPLYKPLLS